MLEDDAAGAALVGAFPAGDVDEILATGAVAAVRDARWHALATADDIVKDVPPGSSR